jgi:Na+/citrate or Na+/malate symporter
MILFAIIDWKWFKFYPLESGIFIDVCNRNAGDLALFN